MTFIQFSSPTYMDDEPNLAVITLTRTGITSGTSSVQFSTLNGTAFGGAACGLLVDYITVTNQTVNFAAGQTTATVNVQICGDISAEGPETVVLRLSNPVNAGIGAAGSSVGPNTDAVLTINDTANQFRNTQCIDLFENTFGTLYPSQILVSGATTNLFRVRVTLYDYWSNSPDNVDVLLVGPNGAKYILMADAGGFVPIPASNTRTLTFTDSAPQVIADSSAPATGAYQPVNWETPVSTFPVPAPPAPYVEPGSTIARPVGKTMYGNFAGINANGIWSLYVRDDGNFPRPEVQSGAICGWGIELLPVTSVGVDVSGRVVTADGRGIRNAVVEMTDPHGITRSVVTSSFGYYRFEGVMVGTSYVMGVRSRQYRFVPRVVTVLDTLNNVDFVGLE